MNSHLPFLLPWVRVNLLIRSLTGRMWDERTWPIATHLGRAFEICRGPSRSPSRVSRTRDPGAEG